VIQREEQPGAKGRQAEEKGNPSRGKEVNEDEKKPIREKRKGKWRRLTELQHKNAAKPHQESNPKSVRRLQKEERAKRRKKEDC